MLKSWSSPLQTPVLLTFTCVLMCLLSCSDDDSTSPEEYTATQEFSYSFPVASQTSFRLGGINGTISVRGLAEADSIKIWGIRRVESDSQVDADNHLSDLLVQVTNGTDDVMVWTEQPEDTEERNYEVDYNIELPADWELDIANINGTITVDDQTGDCELHQTNGPITVENIHANVEAAISNGNFSGDIRIPTTGYCEIELTNGTLELGIPTTTSAYFQAAVTNGSITLTDLDLQNENVTPNLVTGTLGEGEGSIDLLVVNGLITVDGF